MAGVAAGLHDREDGEVAPGVDGSVFGFGRGDRAFTVLLTRVHASVAFIPALVCRDRASTNGRPAELPAERWEETALESDAFNRRYLLLSLAGQDAGLLRELFSPSLIAWLEREPPAGFSFELNEGFLTVALPGRLEGEERSRFLALASEVSRRLDAEIAEEGELSLDVFDEADELRDLETGLAEVAYDDPPETVQAAISKAKIRASRKPAVLLKALLWAAVGGGVAGAAGLAFGGPVLAAVAGIAIGVPALYLGWLVGRAAYRWGKAGSVSRVGLEGWTRGYAQSRGMTLEDRWRFHGRHKDLPMPGFADHVLSGAIPGVPDLHGRLLFLGDAAELRATGQEIAFVTDRPLASTALLVEIDRDLPAAPAVELPDEYRLEVHGGQILVWRPVQGNLLRTSAGTDRFCEQAGGVVAEVRSKPAVPRSQA